MTVNIVNIMDGDSIRECICCLHTSSMSLQHSMHQGMYKSYASNAKFVNAASRPHLHFMAMSVAEVYSLDGLASYQYAFGFVRQVRYRLASVDHILTHPSWRCCFVRR